MNELEIKARADRVKHLLQNPDLQEAFEEVKRFLLEEYCNCPTNDIDTMQDISKRLHLLKSVQALLERAIEAGTLVDYELEEKERGFLKEIYSNVRGK